MSDLIGQELGPYRILEQIGTGGMATVFKAYHAAMDRYVAIKVLPEQMSASTEFRQRFEREAKVIARLAHAHILPVHDYGQANGRLYLVMRYIEAGTLKDRMTAESMDLKEVNRIFAQVAGALDYAHRLGVVHRDIKPSNVLLDDQGNCYLTDFGLAKMLQASIKLTATGVGMGTPAYMSPEQGKGDAVDARSDLYSLGVMLYELVTGRVPYEAETPMAVVLKHITEPLPLPGDVKPGVPPSVERVILKAMAKEPEDRFQMAGKMAEALEAAVRMAPTEAPLPAAERVPTPSTEGFLTRGADRLREFAQTSGGRAAVWGVVGLGALLLFFLILSNIPLKVQIKGGQLEVVRIAEGTPSPSPMAGPTEETRPSATPIVAVTVEATSTATTTSEPRPTATDDPTQTPAPTVTSKPQPTITLESLPKDIAAERARAFAEPILTALKDRPPDYADTFSNPDSGWSVGQNAGWSARYQDGAYILEATPGNRADGHWLTLPPLQDFVLEAETQRLSGNQGDWAILLRYTEVQDDSNGVCAIGFGPDDQVGQGCCLNDYCPMGASAPPQFVHPFDQVNRVMIVVRGSQIAVAVNDHWSMMEADPFYNMRSPQMQLELEVTNAETGDTPFRIRWDNFKIWDISDVAQPSIEKSLPELDVTQLALYQEAGQYLAWSPDGTLLAVGGHNVDLYDVQAQQKTQELATGTARNLTFSPDGAMLAWENHEGVHLWDTAGWSELRTLPGSDGTDDLAFSPDGVTLVTATGSTVKLWDVASGAELRTIPAGSSLNAVSFSPDGRTVASGGLGEVKLWDAATGDELHTLDGHTNWVKSVTFSPDGSTLASGSVDGTVRLWDVGSGRQVHLLSGHTDQVESVAFSPDGSMLASASWDLTVRLWDLASGNEMVSLTGHPDWVTCVALSPDGTMLASGSRDQMRLWRLTP